MQLVYYKFCTNDHIQKLSEGFGPSSNVLHLLKILTYYCLLYNMIYYWYSLHIRHKFHFLHTVNNQIIYNTCLNQITIYYKRITEPLLSKTMCTFSLSSSLMFVWIYRTIEIKHGIIKFYEIFCERWIQFPMETFK